MSDDEVVTCFGFVWSLCGALRVVGEVPLELDAFCGATISGGDEWGVPRNFEWRVRAPVSGVSGVSGVVLRHGVFILCSLCVCE